VRQGRSPKVVDKLDDLTDDILDLVRFSHQSG